MEKELKALNQQNKMAVWADRISACRSSGRCVKAWCQENGICEGTFYKWQKKLFEIAQTQQQTSFVEITPPVHPASRISVTIRLSGVEADIHSGADAETVALVLRLLQSC